MPPGGDDENSPEAASSAESAPPPDPGAVSDGGEKSEGALHAEDTGSRDRETIDEVGPPEPTERSSTPLGPRPLPEEEEEGEQWGSRARSLAICALIGAALVHTLQLTFSDGWVSEFLAENELNKRGRALLLAGLGGGALSGLVLGAAGMALMRRFFATLPRTVEGVLWFVSPLVLLPLLPTLFRPKPWTKNYEVLLPIMVLVILVTEFFALRSMMSVPDVVRKALDRARASVPRFLERHGPWLVVLSAVLAYVVFMSFYTLRMHYKFGTHNYDLSIENNLLFGGLHGEFNQSRMVFPTAPEKYMAAHMKLGAYLFLPFYALYPKPEFLLVLQSLLLGLCAVPLFAFAKRHISEWMAVGLALAFLCYYPMHAVNFYEVHYLSMSAFFVLATIWAADAKRWVWFGLAFACALLMREDMAVGLTILGGFLLLSGYRPRLGFMMVILAGSWFVFIRFYVMAQAGSWWFPSMYKDLFAEGEKGFGSVIKTLLTNPLYTLQHVIVEKKLMYLLHLLTPLAFLPLRRWYLWAALLPGGLLTLLITDYDPPITFSFQYVMHWAPYLFAAAALALASLFQRADFGPARARAAFAALLFGSAVLTFNWGAFPQRAKSFKSGFHTVDFTLDKSDVRRHEEAYELIAMIPPEASVSTTESIGPHVSSRKYFYSMRKGPSGAEYILAERRSMKYGRTKPEFAKALKREKYGVVKMTRDFALLKKGHDPSRNKTLLRRWKL